MREIKFRAWDKEYFKFHRIESIEFLDGEVENVIIQNYMPIHISKIELMQYTGLKDKNGVEIYEGDVVKFFPLYDGSFNIYEVLMEYHAWCFLAKTKEYKTFEDCCTLDGSIDCEVIGNIYENPELLGVTK